MDNRICGVSTNKNTGKPGGVSLGETAYCHRRRTVYESQNITIPWQAQGIGRQRLGITFKHFRKAIKKDNLDIVQSKKTHFKEKTFEWNFNIFSFKEVELR